MSENHKSETCLGAAQRRRISNQKLVLLSCCAPCSAGAIVQLKQQGANFCVLFYNPNIWPAAEYEKRLSQQIRACEENGVEYHALEYDHEEWLEHVRGLEGEPERGLRCAKCFEFRFARGIRWARENGYTHIASVFGVSKYKNQEQVDSSYPKSESEIRYIPIEFDENLRNSENKKFNFYRQTYCGCEFSNKNQL